MFSAVGIPCVQTGEDVKQVVSQSGKKQKDLASFEAKSLSLIHI